MQLQQAMGDLWVEAFYRDWLSDHQNRAIGGSRMRNNLTLRQKLLRESLIVCEHRVRDPKFGPYADLFLALLAPPHNYIEMPLEDFALSAQWPKRWSSLPRNNHGNRRTPISDRDTPGQDQEAGRQPGQSE